MDKRTAIYFLLIYFLFTTKLVCSEWQLQKIAGEIELEEHLSDLRYGLLAMCNEEEGARKSDCEMKVWNSTLIGAWDYLCQLHEYSLKSPQKFSDDYCPWNQKEIIIKEKKECENEATLSMNALIFEPNNIPFLHLDVQEQQMYYLETICVCSPGFLSPHLLAYHYATQMCQCSFSRTEPHILGIHIY